MQPTDTAPIHTARKSFVELSKERERRRVKSILDKHIQEKIANQQWLFKSINQTEVFFPYIAGEGEATIVPKIVYPGPGHQPESLPKIEQNELPNYLVNVPVAHRPAEQGYEQFNRLINLYRNESFEESEKASREVIQQCFALVVGVNQIESLDPEMNRRFEDWMQNIPIIEGIAYRVFGFYWEPLWLKKEGAVSRTYPVSKAFLTLKALSAAAAERARVKLEGEPGKLSPNLVGQIPFQRIREEIKGSRYTADFAYHFTQEAPSSPLYFGVMDADTLRLRIKDGAGLFTRLDQTLEKYKNPSAVTHGYSVEEPDNPLIELGVRLDMACRAAMNDAISYGAYLPEPGTFFCVKAAKGNLMLFKMSFIGEGRVLENRRLIQNGLKAKVLERDAVFVADGGVVTSTPARMRTIKNSEVTELTANNLKTITNLKALRAVSQSHINPKQWAENLYIGLNVKVSRVTDATKRMMHLFSIYDPLSRMFAVPGNFSKTVFDDVFNNYYAPLSDAQTAIKNEARQALLTLKINEEMVDKIVKAAEASGKAIYELLKKVLEEEV